MMDNFKDIICIKQEWRGTKDATLNSPAGNSAGLGKATVNIEYVKAIRMVG